MKPSSRIEFYHALFIFGLIQKRIKKIKTKKMPSLLFVKSLFSRKDKRKRFSENNRLSKFTAPRAPFLLMAYAHKNHH